MSMNHEQCKNAYTQNTARLQILWEWLQRSQTLGFSTLPEFLKQYPGARSWFDENGVPVHSWLTYKKEGQ